MRTISLPRLLAIGLTILVLAGCQAAAPATPETPPASGTVPSSPADPSAAPTAHPSVVAEQARAWLLLGRRSEPDLQLVLSTTGEVGLDIPAGTPRATWERVVTATGDGDTTIVRDLVVQPGFGGPELRVPGRWQLPTVGLDPIPAGRSLDGSTIALVERAYDGSADDSPGLSRFAIVEHHLGTTVQTAGDAPLRLARVIELAGHFEYDALSPEGRILYVVQHLDDTAGGRYQVRAVDVATGVMREAIIVDKGNPDETMAGSPIAQLRQPGGLVLTLHRGPEHPFIHALMSTEAWAICIDLPTDGSFGAAVARDPEAALDWGLAEKPNGATVYAVNASLGIVVEIDPAQLSVRRSASIEATAAAPTIALAKFGHGEVGPMGRRLVVAPDGSGLFAAGADGLVAIRTKDLVVSRHDLAGSAIDGLGISPDGTTLFALLSGGEVVALDAATGHRLGTVPGSGYDRLLAVAPW
jgi:hypothetical protein